MSSPPTHPTAHGTGPKRRGTLRRVLPDPRSAPGASLGVVVTAATCAVLSGLIFLCSMTYTLVHYRYWPGFGAFAFSLLLTLIALMVALPHLIAHSESLVSVLPRLVMWGVAVVFAGLQYTASTLHTGQLPISAFIGVVTVLAVPVFSELAGKVFRGDHLPRTAATPPAGTPPSTRTRADVL